MKYIPMTILEYRFDENGKTKAIVVQINTYVGDERINAGVVLTREYMEEVNPNMDMDRMNKEQCDMFARRRLREWIAVEPAKEEEPEA